MEPKQLTDLEVAIKLEEIDREEYQAKRMYSEEDVYHILCEHTAFLFARGKSTLSEWFEQYKKK